jgi:hypothetical protein
MANYSNTTDLGYRLGITIGAGTIPSTTSAADLLDKATGLINAEVRVSTNMTDTYGELAEIELDLVLRMIRNIWSFKNPDVFPYETVELTPSQIRIIHRIHLKFSGDTFDKYE